MSMTLLCPKHGEVRVTMEDVVGVVMRGPAAVEVLFACPECGERMAVSAAVPAVLAAALEALADGDGEGIAAVFLALADDAPEPRTPDPGASEEEIESYCEYFRRELDSVSCVEDALAEIDGRQA